MFPVVEAVLTILIRAAIYILVSASLALVFGIASVASFIQGDVLMLGAYVAFFAMSIGLNPILAIALAAATTFAFGAFFEKILLSPLRKVSGRLWIFNTFVLTLGVSQILQNGALVTFGPMFRGVRSLWEGNIGIFGVITSLDRIILLITSTSIIVILWAFLKYTRVGRAIRATGINEEAVGLFGINVKKIYMLTFGIACMLAGIAGAFYMSLFTASPTMGITPNLKAWIIVLIAGLGNVKGAIFCSLLLSFIETISYYFLSVGWQNVLIVLAVVLVLLFKPTGIFGTEVRGIWER